MGWRRKFRHDLDAQWAALEHLEDLIDSWDKAADAAMLEPGCPTLPEQVPPPIPVQRAPEKPRDIMGGSNG